MPDRAERIAYYNKHNIAYVARPGHGKEGFVRVGRFKKASNMNFCLTVSRWSPPAHAGECRAHPASGRAT